MPTRIYPHPEKKQSTVSHGGKTFTANEDGSIDVPDDAVEVFVESHGFSAKPHTKEAGDNAKTDGEKKADAAKAEAAKKATKEDKADKTDGEKKA